MSGLLDNAIGSRGKALLAAPGGQAADVNGGDPDLSRLVGYAEEAIIGTQTENELSQRDFDYYHSKQWTAKEREALALRRQPCITDNQIKEKINILAGLELKARADPAAWPRTPNDEENADAATKALRYVKDDNNYDVIRSQIYRDMLIGGCGAIECIVEDIPNNGDGDESYYGDNDPAPQKRNPRVKYNYIKWNRFLRDPRSAAPDFSDSKYIGTVCWMDFEDAVDMFPDAENLLAYQIATSGLGYRTYDDKPNSMPWLDANRRRVRFVQLNYKQKGIWHLATFTRGGWLSEPQVSPYVDREGRPSQQFFGASAYVDEDTNSRYGYVRDLVDKQDEINKRRSKMQHLLNVRQVQMQKGAVADEDVLRRELAKPDGLLITNMGFDFKIIETGDLAQGQLQLLEQIQARMVASGPNASMAGKDDRDLSGKAIIAQQAGGSLELAPIADQLRQLDRALYEATWLRIRQFWTGPQWIRVTKDGEDTKWVGLNRKVTLAEALADQPPEVQAQYQQQLNLQPNDPRLSDVVATLNDVGNMDLDITVDDAPEFPTIAAEQFQQLTDLAGGGVPIPPEVLIAASSLRDKKDLLDKLKESQQAGAQAQADAQKMASAKMAADVQKTQAQTGQIQAQTQKSAADTAHVGAQTQQTASNTVLTNAEALFATHRARQAMVESYAAAAALPLIDQARRSQESVLPGVH